MTWEKPLTLQYLDDLRLFDFFFEYKGKSYRYEEISGITHGASQTQYTLAFVPINKSYNAYLRLHFDDGTSVNIEQERPLVYGAERYAEPVVKAAAIFAQRTYPSRLLRYLAKLKENNFVTVGKSAVPDTRTGYDFYLDGRVECAGQALCNVRDRKVGREMYHSQMNLYVPRTILGLKTSKTYILMVDHNRDCVLKLLNFMYGFTWRNQTIPE